MFLRVVRRKLGILLQRRGNEKSLRTTDVHQGSVLSPLLFAIVVGVITKNIRRDMVNELLYPDDLVLMSKTMED